MSETAKVTSDLENELSLALGEAADRVNRLERDNAALLAACKTVLADLDSGFGVSVTRTNQLRTAIAQAEQSNPKATL